MCIHVHLLWLRDHIIGLNFDNLQYAVCCNDVANKALGSSKLKDTNLKATVQTTVT